MRPANGQSMTAPSSRCPVADQDEAEPDWAALDLVGRSPCFRDALACLQQWSRVDATVLICGETGTGKELAARALHYLGARSGGPFVPVNCGAIADSLLEAELFGHVKGAFTDAKQDARGMISLASGGTLFLDEVDALSPRAQAALLRFVQDHSYRPVGGARFQHGDVRLVAASNADLDALSERGVFRHDLLYRLNLLTVALPPLRQREGDALLLAQVFVQRLCRTYGVQRQLDAPSREALQRPHPWHGNVRELEHLVHRCFLRARGNAIDLGLAPGRAANAPFHTPAEPTTALGFAQAKAQVIAEFERRYLYELLQRAQGNLSLAARLAGKERSRFGKLVKKYGLQRDADPPRT
jgi:DNA-binding NtrC family response regulator